MKTKARFILKFVLGENNLMSSTNTVQFLHHTTVKQINIIFNNFYWHIYFAAFMYLGNFKDNNATLSTHDY